MPGGGDLLAESPEDGQFFVMHRLLPLLLFTLCCGSLSVFGQTVTISEAVVIEFESLSSGIYQIQSSPDGKDWADDGFAIQGTGDTVRVVRGTSDEREFFRVVFGSESDLPPTVAVMDYIICIRGAVPDFFGGGQATSQPVLGEVRLFAGPQPPEGWASCRGQLLSIAQFNDLFNVIGTSYGGDGKTSFALPDLRGAVPIGGR